MIPDGANIRVVEMSMNDAWFRDIGPTVSFSWFYSGIFYDVSFVDV